MKVRPAVVVSASHPSVDLIIVPLTSRTGGLLPGEFALADWKAAGLHVPTAVKRGAYTIHPTLIAKRVGRLSAADEAKVGDSLRSWIGL
ncbi:MAG TPA: type II toxin-antitoxin system PemK/MazF family toxin [Longimicrobiaceae bacterium]|nr:type II toxin-antitoxin system PemK/MazF family toxin [Longimicrobiaceae bacterium]